MDLALLALFAALVTAVCQSVTDLGTKAATREADDRAILAAQWGVGVALLSAACLISPVTKSEFGQAASGAMVMYSAAESTSAPTMIAMTIALAI